MSAVRCRSRPWSGQGRNERITRSLDRRSGHAPVPLDGGRGQAVEPPRRRSLRRHVAVEVSRRPSPVARRGQYRVGIRHGAPTASTCRAIPLTEVAIRQALSQRGAICLPAGTVTVSKPLRITRSGTRLIGAGRDLTVLQIAFGPTASGPLIALPAEWSDRTSAAATPRPRACASRTPRSRHCRSMAPAKETRTPSGVVKRRPSDSGSGRQRFVDGARQRDAGRNRNDQGV